MDGKLAINPADVTVNITGHQATAVYDSEAHGTEGYDVAISNTLYTANDFTFSGTNEIARVDAGESRMELRPWQFRNENPNFNVAFNVVEDGKVTIAPKPVNIQIVGDNAIRTYNGNEQWIGGYTNPFWMLLRIQSFSRQ